MENSQFKFQRLPSAFELSSLPPTDRHAEEYLGPSPLPNLQGSHRYEPVSSSSIHRPVRRGAYYTGWKGLVFLGHLILTLSPLLFIVLAFRALTISDKPVSRAGRIVIQAARIGPTIFPIIFAAVVGRLMKNLALWRAERGSTIGLLEQLNGSQNFIAAIERAFLLRGLGGISVVIVVLWALSPLGGQSSLRVISLDNSQDPFQDSVRYFNTDNATDTTFQGASAIAYGWPSVSAIYSACLLAPNAITASASDLWGNVKIPTIQTLPSYSALQPQNWVEVGHTDDTVYSALNGIVVTGLYFNATANFTIETSYFNLTCSEPSFFTTDVADNTTGGWNDFLQWTGDLSYHSNKSDNVFGVPASTDPNYSWSSFMVDSNWNWTTNPNQTDINIIYASRNGDTGSIAGYNCSVGFTHVESDIGCERMNCQVNRIRHSSQNTASPSITPWNSGTGNFVPFANFLRWFPWAAGSYHSGDTSPTDFYIAGSSSPFQPFGQGQSTNYTNVTGAQVSERLATMVNTLWQTSLARTAIAAPKTLNSTSLALTAEDFHTRNTTAAMVYSVDVFVANKTWVGLTAVISLILLFCGIAGMALKYMSRAPDILGYVSTMTRDNPHFRTVLDGGDRLDGLERARALRDVVVQIANVNPFDDRGHIALKSVAGEEDRAQSRLKNNLSSL